MEWPAPVDNPPVDGLVALEGPAFEQSAGLSGGNGVEMALRGDNDLDRGGKFLGRWLDDCYCVCFILGH